MARRQRVEADSSTWDTVAEEVLREVRVAYEAPRWHALATAAQKLVQHMLSPSSLRCGHQLSAGDAPTFVSSLSAAAAAAPAAGAAPDPDAAASNGPGSVSFTFHPPASAAVVGTFPMQTVARPFVSADVAVVMPKECFREKDFLNYRYHAKRALYLLELKRQVAVLDWIESVTWNPWHGDPSKPVLLVTPKECGGAHIRVRACLSAHTFGLKKLRPARNNVRSAKTKAGQPLATPQYNASILEDVLDLPATSSNSSSSGATEVEGEAFTSDCAQLLLEQQLDSIPALRDAILLLKVWSRQRWHSDNVSPSDGVDGFLLSLIAAHLSTAAGGGRLGPHMTAMQMFRVIMDVLATSPLLETGFAIEVSAAAESNGGAAHGRHGLAASAPELAERMAGLQKAYALVVCDSYRCINYAWRVRASALRELRTDARNTLAAISAADSSLLRPVAAPAGSAKGAAAVAATTTTVHDAIAAAFLTRCRFATKFDVHVRVEVAAVENAASDIISATARRQLEDKALRVLTEALGDRASLVRVVAPSPSSSDASEEWLLEDEAMPDSISNFPIRLGVSLTSIDNAQRLVDKGPSAEFKDQCRRFRAFWGAKSELRRWKDGSVTECVAWECPITERHLIVPRIIQYALARHLSVPEASIGVTSNQLDRVLLDGGLDPMAASPHLQSAYERLSLALRKMSSLPLAVVAVHVLSPALTRTAPFPPLPLDNSQRGSAAADTAAAVTRVPRASDIRLTDPVEIAIQLEGSGKWPDDVDAVRTTRHAFCLQMAKCLAEEHGAQVTASDNEVDVLMDGFAFRLHLVHDFSGKPSAATVGPNQPAGVGQAPTWTNQNGISSKNAAAAVVAAARNIQAEAAHHSLVQAVTAKFPAYPPVARLAKRWVGAHLMSNHLCDEAVELIAANAFVRLSSPLDPPVSRLTGFLRFLELLSSHDWSSSPLIVDPNGDIRPESHSTIQASFQAAMRDSATTGSGDEPSEQQQGPHRKRQKHHHKTKDGKVFQSATVAAAVAAAAVNGSAATTAAAEGHQSSYAAAAGMWIATPYDVSTSMWTREQPSKSALDRICRFARASAQTMSTLMSSVETQPKRWKSLFCTPLRTAFDVVLLLHPAAVVHRGRVLFQASKLLPQAPPPRHGHKDTHGKVDLAHVFREEMSAMLTRTGQLQTDVASCRTVVGFNPTRILVTELQRHFSSQEIDVWCDIGSSADAIGIILRKKKEGDVETSAAALATAMARFSDFFRPANLRTSLIGEV